MSLCSGVPNKVDSVIMGGPKLDEFDVRFPCHEVSNKTKYFRLVSF